MPYLLKRVESNKAKGEQMYEKILTKYPVGGAVCVNIRSVFYSHWQLA